MPSADAITLDALLASSFDSSQFPKLSLCLAHLETSLQYVPHHFEEIFLCLVSLYASSLELALDRKMGISVHLHASRYSAIAAQWKEILSVPLAGTLGMFPDFDDMYDEMLRKHSWDTSPLDGFRGTEALHGIHLSTMQSWAFQACQVANDKYVNIVQQICTKQPIYTDVPSNYDRYLQALHTQGADPFFGLTHALQPSIHNEAEVLNILHFFGVIPTLVLEVFYQTDSIPLPNHIAYLSHRAVLWWRRALSDPLVLCDIRIRRRLAGINIRGIVELMCQYVRKLLSSYPPNLLGWYLYTWFVNCASSTFVSDSHGTVALVLLKTGMSTLLTQEADPVRNYLPEQFIYYTEIIDRETLLVWGAAEETADDVKFETVGEDLNAKDYADIIVSSDGVDAICVICQDALEIETIVRLHVCKHELHLECVQDSINQLHSGANRCPLCRKIIAPQRAKRAVLE